MSKIHSNQSINCLLIRGKEGTENSKSQKALVDYSQTIDDVYENLKDQYNPTEKSKVLIVFDDVVANMESNKKLSSKVTELFLR